MDAEQKKAIELVNSFKVIEHYDNEGNIKEQIFQTTHVAKQCAIKCCEEKREIFVKIAKTAKRGTQTWYAINELNLKNLMVIEYINQIKH